MQLKLKSDLILREVAGQHVIVPVGKIILSMMEGFEEAYMYVFLKNNGI